MTSPSGEVMKTNTSGTVTIKGEDGTRTVTLTPDSRIRSTPGRRTETEG